MDDPTPPADPSLDELFGAGHGQPTPRIRAIALSLGVGLVLAVLGMTCSAAPGGLLVLVAWVLVEKELDRVESGYLSTEFKPRLEQLQLGIYVAVVTVILLFAAQFWLLRRGFYEALWGGFIMAIREAVL